MVIEPDQDGKSKDASQETKEAMEETPSRKMISAAFLNGLLTFLGGAITAGLWLKFISFRRFEVEWGMDFFRDPKMLAVLSFFFFLMGMGLVCGIRNIIIWLRECRTYS